jgi:hypothetical protein
MQAGWPFVMPQGVAILRSKCLRQFTQLLSS